MSALAASALPSLVLARGHRIEGIPEVPLVVEDAAESITKTKAAIDLLKKVGGLADAAKAKESKNLRRGKGKMRNRRYVNRKGPLIVYDQDNGITKAFRNLPGVDVLPVSALNLLHVCTPLFCTDLLAVWYVLHVRPQAVIRRMPLHRTHELAAALSTIQCIGMSCTEAQADVKLCLCSWHLEVISVGSSSGLVQPSPSLTASMVSLHSSAAKHITSISCCVSLHPACSSCNAACSSERVPILPGTTAIFLCLVSSAC